MSSTRRRDSQQMRVMSRSHAPADIDRTMVDIVPRPARNAGNGSVAQKLRDDAETRIAGREKLTRTPSPSSILAQPTLPARAPKGTAPPENVIPFTKPRAIATIAAADPSSLVIRDTNLARRGPVVDAPTNVALKPVSSVQPAQPAPVPLLPARPVAMPAPSQVPAATPPPSMVVPTPMAPSPSSAPLLPPLPAAAAPVTVPSVPEPAPAPHDQWSTYKQLGLGPPKLALPANATPRQQQIAKLLVSVYRLLGFGILTIIVVILIGYITTTAFFYVSDSWVVPMAVSPTDEKVVTLQAQLSELQTQRDRLDDELDQAERAIEAQQAFQEEFAKAIKGDLEGRNAALGRVRALASAAAATRQQIKSQSSAYASQSRKQMAQEYAAGLIDRNAMLSGKFQLAQITSANLSLAERQAEFETRAQELEAQTRSLDLILDSASAGDNDALSYEVLRIKQEYEASRLDLAKAVETRDTLQSALERQDKMIESFKSSAYLRAVEDGASVAFVPYANLGDAKKGEDLYACKVGMIICYHVGTILEVLPGEVQFKHPHRDKMLRGRMLELKLDDDEMEASSEDVLFAGGRPLLF